MATKIRLQRHGKKGKPFFHIVAADARSKRDGKFIEKLGTYNPCTNPATIDLNLDRAFHWLTVGAQPTDTARAILSYKGVLYKNHLAKGVTKGALTQEQADAKFATWMEEKQGRIDAKIDGLDKNAEAAAKATLAAEKKQNEERAAAIAAANTPPAEEAPAKEEE
jgi:small subunit ribosomal protein S16